jgi:hypothetical protein
LGLEDRYKTKSWGGWMMQKLSEKEKEKENPFHHFNG